MIMIVMLARKRVSTSADTRPLIVGSVEWAKELTGAERDSVSHARGPRSRELNGRTVSASGGPARDAGYTHSRRTHLHHHLDVRTYIR